MSRSAADLLGAQTRDDSTRILATLIRLTGDITLAEDALQDAMVKALSTWDSIGIPDSPRAWVIVTARRCAVDRIRKEARRTDKEAPAMALFANARIRPNRWCEMTCCAWCSPAATRASRSTPGWR